MLQLQVLVVFAGFKLNAKLLPPSTCVFLHSLHTPDIFVFLYSSDEAATKSHLFWLIELKISGAVLQVEVCIGLAIYCQIIRGVPV